MGSPRDKVLPWDWDREPEQRMSVHTIHVHTTTPSLRGVSYNTSVQRKTTTRRRGIKETRNKEPRWKTRRNKESYRNVIPET
ncbi:hypothetical protein KQX54_007592 [Cotesia glomerata]|uniref:Uncharacterized protein n=1 Tax=Cotesia glomerata TaxID=32391 RepID=A0AAV7IKI3_COTGL|nr:hypothetical protein KQX54_007592 [Cotesia glomerata]